MSEWDECEMEKKDYPKNRKFYGYRSRLANLGHGGTGKMASVDPNVENFLYLQQICIYVFEGIVMDRILERWFMYKPLRDSGLRRNLTEIIKSICLADIRVEITPTHIQIFDCTFLKIPSHILKEFPNVIRLFQKIFPFFARTKVDNAQREIFLQGYKYDDLLESILSRESMLIQVINNIYYDSIKMDAFPQTRDMVIGILSELYGEAVQSKKSMISNVIQILRPSADTYLNTVPCDTRNLLPSSRIPMLAQICILVNNQYCPRHTTCQDFASTARDLYQDVFPQTHSPPCGIRNEGEGEGTKNSELFKLCHSV